MHLTSARGADFEIRASIAASVQDAEEFFREFRAHGQSLPEPGQRFIAELLVREAVNNAVIHGCGADPSRQVRCAVRFRWGRLLIVVADQGKGFDWRTAWSRKISAAAPSGRGMEIFRRYATRVRFNRAGNATAILKRFDASVSE